MKCKLATIFSVLVLAWLIEDAAAEPRLRIGWARRRRRRRHCNKVDCAFGSWSSWSSCSHTCGAKGLQHRTRGVVRPASCGGAPCHGPLQESRSCNRVCLNGGVLKYGSRCYCKYGYGGECCQIVSGGWTSWGPWCKCSRTCGKGTQYRKRSCTKPDASCPGNSREYKSCTLRQCQAPDGGWSFWSSWGQCTGSCGTGLQTRKRSCTNPPPGDGGKKCMGATEQHKNCFLQSCPVNGAWSSWGKWSTCSKTCGSGQQTSRRSCNNPPPRYGGKTCYGSATKSRSCHMKSCAVNGGWSFWSKWSSCSKTCGSGSRSRQRSCTKPRPGYGGKPCYGPPQQTQSCNTKKCPVNGRWGSWGKWCACSKTCGTGTQYRKRYCTNPRPAYGGKQCKGVNNQTKKCNTQACPVNGGWSKWGPWGACSKTCGDGKQYSRRTCNNPAPKYGGKKCFGASVKPQTCNVKPCPVNGRWGSWSKWCACSKTCGTGTQYRKRYCTNPRPTSGGKQCKGVNKQNKKCNTKACSVNGGWSLWGKWCACSKTCGTGTQYRARSCTKPRPAYGGKQCSGLSKEYLKCNKQACSVNGRWTLWGAWSKCTKTCGTGSQTRRRSCSNPPPQQGGKACTGPSEQNKSCLLKKCPVYGGWSSWGKWSVCSKSCGTGTQHRTRTCSGYRAGYGGCPGSDRENRNCNSQSCPVHGGWGDWGDWSPCSVTCGPGSSFRTRKCDNPPPGPGGNPCPGGSVSRKDCNLGICAQIINGGWGDWSHWSPCSATCGPGTSFRTRPCDNPAPGPGGSPCPGVAISSKDCNLKACAGSEDCWDDWSDWSKCTKGCGCGRRFRVRYCQCAHGQQHDKCQGLGEESESCQCNPCPNGPPNDVIEG